MMIVNIDNSSIERELITSVINVTFLLEKKGRVNFTWLILRMAPIEKVIDVSALLKISLVISITLYQER